MYHPKRRSKTTQLNQVLAGMFSVVEWVLWLYRELNKIPVSLQFWSEEYQATQHNIMESRWLSREHCGRSPFDQKFPELWKRGQMVRKFLGKVSGRCENCEIARCKPFTRKFRKFREEIPSTKFTKSWVYLARWYSFPEIQTGISGWMASALYDDQDSECCWVRVIFLSRTTYM